MKRRICCAVTAWACVGRAAIAGPITPPPGPVASTHKTLTEVEPRVAINAVNTPGDANSLYKITQPGSYYLTGNVTGPLDKHGIEVAADRVTIDLGGFTLAGAGFGAGVTLEGARSETIIRNGTLKGWGIGGVNLTYSAASDAAVVENVNAFECGRGVVVGTNARVRNCTARDNNYGFTVSDNSIIESCVAFSNSDSGFGLGEGSVATRCVSRMNGANGFSLNRAVARECTSISNANDGFLCTGSNVAACTSSKNGGHGFVVQHGSVAKDCVSTSNTGAGYWALYGSVIEGCQARSNLWHGINLLEECVARGNTCISNGDANGECGILAREARNVLEDNICFGNKTGIELSGHSMIAVRNKCAGNGVNWSVDSGNRCLVVKAPAGVGFTGDEGGTDLGTTDPNANLTY